VELRLLRRVGRHFVGARLIDVTHHARVVHPVAAFLPRRPQLFDAKALQPIKDLVLLLDDLPD
jgi:hypothetical protein